jgi:hypothetical protein
VNFFIKKIQREIFFHYILIFFLEIFLEIFCQMLAKKKLSPHLDSDFSLVVF